MIDALILGFYNKLASYSNYYKTYHVIAPYDSDLPYVTYGLETNNPVPVFGNLEKIEQSTFWVNCFAESSSVCQDIVDLVIAKLDNSSLSVSGYTHMVCSREFIGAIEYDIESKVYKIPLRYRVLISE